MTPPVVVPERALTLHGAQLCWAVLHRKKKIENRSWTIKPGWYALHCSKKVVPNRKYGKGKKKNGTYPGLTQLQKKLCGLRLPAESELAHFHGHLLGVFRIGRRWSYKECSANPWAVRQKSKSNKSWCYEIVQVFDLSSAGPLPALGKQGIVWEIPQTARAQLARRLRQMRRKSQE